MTEPTPIVLSSPDAGNRGAGEILRRAREAQSLTLEGLASTIKVTPAKLDALEQGRFDSLPDANFTRALAMTVCRALKIDPTEVLAALPAARPAALAEGKPPLNQPFKDVRGGTPLFDRSFDWGSLLSLKWGAPLLLLLGAVVIYALPDSVDVPGWLHRLTQSAPQRPVEGASNVDPSTSAGQGMAPAASGVEMGRAASEPDAAMPGASGANPSLVLDSADPAASVAAPAAVLDPRLTPPGTVPAAAPGAVPAAPVAAQALAPTATAAPAAGMVTLAVRDASWIEVRDAKGAKLLSRHVQAGENLSLDGEAPFNLRIGNAPGVQLSYKGQAVDLAPMTRNNVARVELK